MPALDLIRGPALTAVSAGDAQGLADLGREQRARLETLREERLWDWLGGLDADQPSLWPLWCLFSFLGLAPLAVLTAGFTLGPVLWCVLALTALSPLPYWLLYVPVRRRTRRLLEHAGLRPAVVVACDTAAHDEDGDEPVAVWALAGDSVGRSAGAAGPDALRALVAAGDRLAAQLREPPPADDALAPFVRGLRERIDARVADGRRCAAPRELGEGLEVAHLLLHPINLPGERLSSRLLFVLADVARDGPASTRVVPSPVWGRGVEALCAAFPWEESR